MIISITFNNMISEQITCLAQLVQEIVNLTLHKGKKEAS